MIYSCFLGTVVGGTAANVVDRPERFAKLFIFHLMQND